MLTVITLASKVLKIIELIVVLVAVVILMTTTFTLKTDAQDRSDNYRSLLQSENDAAQSENIFHVVLNTPLFGSTEIGIASSTDNYIQAIGEDYACFTKRSPGPPWGKLCIPISGIRELIIYED